MDEHSTFLNGVDSRIRIIAFTLFKVKLVTLVSIAVLDAIVISETT